MWQPAWGSTSKAFIVIYHILSVVRTILLALRDHFTVDDKAAIGYLDYSSEARKELARNSRHWKCKLCQYVANLKCDEPIDETNQQVSLDNSKTKSSDDDTQLLWIGAILLILSIVTSYFYLYLT